MDDEIDLRDIFRILWKNRLLIIGIFLIAVVVAGVISFAMPSVYRVSCIVALGNFGDPVYTNQASAKEIMLSDAFMLDVIDRLNLNVPSGSEFKAFKDCIKIEPVKDANRLLVISVETPNPGEGKEIVEEVIWNFANLSEKSYSKQEMILSGRLASTQERLATVGMHLNQTREALGNLEKAQGSSQIEDYLRISRMLDVLNSEESRRSALLDRYLDLQDQLDLLRSVEILQSAREPVSPAKPQRALIVAIAGILGLMVGIFAAFLREGLRGRVE